MNTKQERIILIIWVACIIAFLFCALSWLNAVFGMVEYNKGGSSTIYDPDDKHTALVTMPIDEGYVTFCWLEDTKSKNGTKGFYPACNQFKMSEKKQDELSEYIDYYANH